jgi:branched-chain amino acid aminotransferase
VESGRIRLADFHFDRLFSGMQVLGFETPAGFTRQELGRRMMDLSVSNGHDGSARLRLTVFRGEGRPEEILSRPHLLLESFPPPLPEREPVRLMVYEADTKSTGILSNLKSNNHLLYVMAAMRARAEKYDEALVLNRHGRICDSNRANVFLLESGIVITPALSEGCVAGVMRRYLLQQLPAMGWELLEKPVTREDLQRADEIFLTNALQPIRPVASVDGRQYGQEQTGRIRSALKFTQ